MLRRLLLVFLLSALIDVVFLFLVDLFWDFCESLVHGGWRRDGAGHALGAQFLAGHSLGSQNLDAQRRHDSTRA